MAAKEPKLVRSTTPNLNITLDGFAEAVSAGVLRAIDARKASAVKLPGRIIIGIVFDLNADELEQ